MTNSERLKLSDSTQDYIENVVPVRPLKYANQDFP